MVDYPGCGEALRFQDLKSRIESEDWADGAGRLPRDPRRRRPRPDRAGRAGRSAGTTRRAPRRSRSGSSSSPSGAPTTTGARCRRSASQREGENPVPHYWEHVLWVWGYDDVETFIEYAEGVHLNGVVEQDHGAVPDRPRRRTTGRSPSTTRTSPTTRRSTARSASCGSSPSRRAPPSTSGSTTCRTSTPTSPTGSRTRSGSWARRDRSTPGTAPRIEGKGRKAHFGWPVRTRRVVRGDQIVVITCGWCIRGHRFGVLHRGTPQGAVGTLPGGPDFRPGQPGWTGVT